MKPGSFYSIGIAIYYNNNNNKDKDKIIKCNVFNIQNKIISKRRIRRKKKGRQKDRNGLP